MVKSLSIIVAADLNNGIGKDNKLLCHLPADLKYFKELTTGNTIIMGRKTFESIGKALPNRISIVITKNPNYIAKDCIVAHSLEEAIKLANPVNKIFIIGGASIYQQALNLNTVDTIYLTRIHHIFEADTFFPKLNPNEWKIISEKHNTKDDKNPFDYTFVVLKKQ